MKVLGQHILIEFCNCDSFILNRTDLVQKHMTDAAIKSQATIVNSVFHHFSPYGVSGVVVIAESHLAIHTWPEYGYAAVDLFTCGTSVEPWTAFEHLKECFRAKSYTVKEMKRGIPDNSVNDTPIQHKPACMAI